MKKIIFIGSFWLLILTVSPGATQEPVYNIENITGDLYRFQSNNHYGVFLVTGEGIILADPISHDTAVWLKGELDERFALPVKYVIYSHDHADHTSGGEVFSDTATFIAHENAAPKIAESGHTPVPDITFSEWYTLKFGGKEVVLYYPGPSHSDNLISVIFPKEKALFQVDSVAVKRLPYRNLPDYYFPEILESLQKILSLDFEILVPGHGVIGTREDAADHLGYLEALYFYVLSAKSRDYSLEKTKQTFLMANFSDWTNYYEWRLLNFEGLFRILESRKDFDFFPYTRQRPYFRETTRYWFGPVNYHPKPIFKGAPEYPSRAKTMKICGWVKLLYNINKGGRPRDIQIIDSEPKGQFEVKARQALERAKFEKGYPKENQIELMAFELRGVCQMPPIR